MFVAGATALPKEGIADAVRKTVEIPGQRVLSRLVGGSL
jgi:hypothetical protein